MRWMYRVPEASLREAEPRLILASKSHFYMLLSALLDDGSERDTGSYLGVMILTSETKRKSQRPA
jgi:hypothetical protein